MNKKFLEFKMVILGYVKSQQKMLCIKILRDIFWSAVKSLLDMRVLKNNTVGKKLIL